VTQTSYTDEFMTPAAVAQQASRTNQTAAYNFGANLRRMEGKIDRLLELVEQLIEEKANQPITGEYPALKLYANMMDGKVYWSVKGQTGPYTKHGASIWPEVLEPAGFGHSQPTEQIDLTGWTAVYTANADGKNPKVTQLIPPTVNTPAKKKPVKQPNPDLKAADLWRQEAISCKDAFMFDTAVSGALAYYTDSEQVNAARGAICGPWDAQRAEATLLALETYATKVNAPSKRPITETKKAALTAARQTYNKGVS